jgi:hypothetical protein
LFHSYTREEKDSNNAKIGRERDKYTESCGGEFNSKYTFLGTATARRLGRLGSEVSVGTILYQVFSP